MRGHIQKRGKDSWRIKALSAGTPPGTKRYVHRTVAGSHREGERELSRLLVEVDEGRHAAAAPMTFGELLDRWLAVKRLAVEPTTLSSYERIVTLPAFGGSRAARALAGSGVVEGGVGGDEACADVDGTGVIRTSSRRGLGASRRAGTRRHGPVGRGSLTRCRI
jgi:hypothetical protein